MRPRPDQVVVQYRVDLRPDNVFARPLAQRLLQAELAAAASLLAGVYGQCGLFVRPCASAPAELPVHLLGDVRRMYVASPHALGGDLRCAADALPFLSESFQLIVVQHAAEALQDSGTFLAEIGRVLAPEGVLLAFGFNPLSLWALWTRLVGSRDLRRPRLLAAAHYRGILQQGDIETLQVRYLGPVWPQVKGLGSVAVDRTHGLARLYFRLRGALLMVARKRRNGVTPVRWRQSARDVAMSPGLLGGTQRSRPHVLRSQEISCAARADAGRFEQRVLGGHGSDLR